MSDASFAAALACIIVHYGYTGRTMACLRSIYAGTRVPLCFVICNSDGTGLHRLVGQGQCFADCPPEIIEMEGNRGYAAACNAGLRAAMANKAIRAVWLLNNDTCVAPDAAERLEETLEQNPRAIIGTSVFQADRSDHLELALGCRFSPVTTCFTPCFPNALPGDVPDSVAVDYVYGASIAFSLDLIREIGFLDERFFLYYEEHDLCLRARKAGWHFVWCREAHVWHEGGASAQSKSTKVTEGRKSSHYHENLSTWKFLAKHHPFLLPVAICVRTLAKIVLLPLRGQAGLLPGYWRSLRDFVMGRGSC